MSETVEGQELNPEKVEQKVDVDALTNRLDSLEKSNQRLLDESKTWKSKYQNVKSEVEQKETEVLAQNNDFKGLWEKSEAEKQVLRDELVETKKSGLETSLQFEVAKYGKDAEDTDILLAAVKTKKRDVLGYDKDSRKWQGVDVAVEELRKTNPGLFLNTIPGMENGRPQSAVEKTKTVDERIDEDPLSVLNEALLEII